MAEQSTVTKIKSAKIKYLYGRFRVKGRDRDRLRCKCPAMFDLELFVFIRFVGHWHLDRLFNLLGTLSLSPNALYSALEDAARLYVADSELQ